MRRSVGARSPCFTRYPKCNILRTCTLPPENPSQTSQFPHYNDAAARNVESPLPGRSPPLPQVKFVHVLVTADTLSGTWTYTRELVSGLVGQEVFRDPGELPAKSPCPDGSPALKAVSQGRPKLEGRGRDEPARGPGRDTPRDCRAPWTCAGWSGTAPSAPGSAAARVRRSPPPRSSSPDRRPRAAPAPGGPSGRDDHGISSPRRIAHLPCRASRLRTPHG